MRKAALAACIIVWSAISFSATARAAQPARVDVTEARILEFPKDGSRVVETLVQGDPVSASNQPIGGYYKVRTASGQVGFVSERDLRVGNAAFEAFEEESEGPKPLRGANEPAGDAKPAEVPRARGSERWGEAAAESPRSALRAFGGRSFFRLKDFEDRLITDGLSGGWHFGGEYRHALSGAWSLLFRAERLQAKWTVTAGANGRDYEVTAASIPLQAGVSYQFHTSETLELGVALLGGAGLQSEAKSVSVADAADDVTYGGTPIGGTLKLEGAWSFARSFGLFAEGGYRFFDVPAANPTDNGTAPASPYIVSGLYEQLQVQLSGLFVSAGFQLRF